MVILPGPTTDFVACRDGNSVTALGHSGVKAGEPPGEKRGEFIAVLGDN